MPKIHELPPEAKRYLAIKMVKSYPVLELLNLKEKEKTITIDTSVIETMTNLFEIGKNTSSIGLLITRASTEIIELAIAIENIKTNFMILLSVAKSRSDNTIELVKKALINKETEENTVLELRKGIQKLKEYGFTELEIREIIENTQQEMEKKPLDERIKEDIILYLMNLYLSLTDNEFFVKMDSIFVINHENRLIISDTYIKEAIRRLEVLGISTDTIAIILKQAHGEAIQKVVQKKINKEERKIGGLFYMEKEATLDIDKLLEEAKKNVEEGPAYEIKKTQIRLKKLGLNESEIEQLIRRYHIQVRQDLAASSSGA